MCVYVRVCLSVCLYTYTHIALGIEPRSTASPARFYFYFFKFWKRSCWVAVLSLQESHANEITWRSIPGTSCVPRQMPRGQSTRELPASCFSLPDADVLVCLTMHTLSNTWGILISKLQGMQLLGTVVFRLCVEGFSFSWRNFPGVPCWVL